jgi:hypothetical protein
MYRVIPRSYIVIPRPVTKFDVRYVEKDFTRNTMLRWKTWCLAKRFDQEKVDIYRYGKFTKLYSLTYEWQLKGKTLPFELQACRLDHHLQSPTIQVTMNESPKDDLNKSITEVWGDKDLLFSFRISSQPASSHPHTSLSIWCCSLLVQIIVLRHSDASCSQSKLLGQLPNRRGPLLRFVAQVSQLLQGCFVSEFQECGWAWATGHGSSATWRHIQSRKH